MSKTGAWPLVAFGCMQVVLFFRVKICCITRNLLVYHCSMVYILFSSLVIARLLSPRDHWMLIWIESKWGKKSILIGFEALWILYNVHSRRESILITLLNLIFVCYNSARNSSQIESGVYIYVRKLTITKFSEF